MSLAGSVRVGRPRVGDLYARRPFSAPRARPRMHWPATSGGPVGRLGSPDGTVAGRPTEAVDHAAAAAGRARGARSGLALSPGADVDSVGVAQEYTISQRRPGRARPASSPAYARGGAAARVRGGPPAGPQAPGVPSTFAERNESRTAPPGVSPQELLFSELLADPGSGSDDASDAGAFGGARSPEGGPEGRQSSHNLAARSFLEAVLGELTTAAEAARAGGSAHAVRRWRVLPASACQTASLLAAACLSACLLVWFVSARPRRSVCLSLCLSLAVPAAVSLCLVLTRQPW